MTTKLNVNIRTLLTNCEQLAKDDANFWRLKKFIKALDTMIAQLKSEETDQSASKVPEYEKRLQALKTTTNYIDSTLTASNLSLMARDLTYADDVVNEVRQLKTSEHYADLRKELLNEGAVRRRKPDETTNTTIVGNDKEAGKYFNQTQEKITEHMLALTRSLREQTETANRIIKLDTEVVSNSTNITDKNINSLQKENEKVENHSKNAWRCWILVMIIFVIITFIGMVLFMKIVKKKKE